MPKITALIVNGKKLQVDVDSEASLLTVLRDDLSLTGSKYGCGEGQCGACTVLIDGQLARSCITTFQAFYSSDTLACSTAYRCHSRQPLNHPCARAHTAVWRRPPIILREKHTSTNWPLSFRLKNLKDERMRAVLEAAAKAFGWDRKKSTARGTGSGICCGFEKGGYVATCAEVAVDHRGRVQIVRVVEAFECGAVVNPVHLQNQIEGAVVMAIGGAMFESIQFANGRILNPRFSKYRLPRFSDMPVIEIVIVDRKDLPSAGAGETPIVGLAPAVGNAIFNATGVRLRSLPLAPSGLAS